MQIMQIGAFSIYFLSIFNHLSSINFLFFYFIIRWSILGSTFLSKSLFIYNDIKKVIQYFWIDILKLLWNLIFPRLGLCLPYWSSWPISDLQLPCSLELGCFWVRAGMYSSLFETRKTLADYERSWKIKFWSLLRLILIRGVFVVFDCRNSHGKILWNRRSYFLYSLYSLNLRKINDNFRKRNKTRFS
jgi:hypothetical protein